MLKSKISETVSALKSMNEAYKRDFNMLYEKDFKESRELLKEGQTVPLKFGNELSLEANKMLLEGFQFELKEKAVETLRDLSAEVEKEKAKAPSNEAIAYIGLLEKRNNLSRDDIDLALKTYGGNYQVEKAILDLATAKEIKTDDLTLVEDTLASMVENLEGQYQSLAHHEKGALGIDSYIASMNQDIENLGFDW